MKFLRQLLAASALVAVVVALGFLWKGSSMASLVADGGGDHGRPPASSGLVPGTGNRPDRGFDRRDSQGLSLGNASDLIQTLVILAAIIGGVAVIDRARRRRHPVSRRAEVARAARSG